MNIKQLTASLLAALCLGASLPADALTPKAAPPTLVGNSFDRSKLKFGRVYRVALMGDSFAAGEGSPNRSGAKWNSTPCHRSNENGRSAALRRLQANIANTLRVPADRLDFIDVACSGATIHGNILGENYRGVIPLTTTGPGEVGGPLDSQLSQVKQWLDGAPLDALIVSIGGNDIGFGHVVVKCMTPLTSCKDDSELETLISKGRFGDSELVGLDFLKDAYADMKARFDAELKPKAVYVVGVPNPLKDQDGRYCDRYNDGVGILPTDLLDPLGHPFATFYGYTLGTVSPTEFDKDEAKWVEDTLVNPLNAKLAQIAQDFSASNWKFIALDYMTRYHGFCSQKPWFHTFKTSLEAQGDFNGIAHPNREGFQVYDAFLYRQLVRHFNVGVRTQPRIENENFHIEYVLNGERKIVTPGEFNFSPDRPLVDNIFIGKRWSIKFRTLVFPAADIVKRLTLQVSTQPFNVARVADIRNFEVNMSTLQVGNFDRSVSVGQYDNGQTLHVRWRLLTRPYWDADGAEQTKFSSTFRVKVNDGLEAVKKL